MNKKTKEETKAESFFLLLIVISAVIGYTSGIIIALVVFIGGALIHYKYVKKHNISKKGNKLK